MKKTPKLQEQRRLKGRGKRDHKGGAPTRGKGTTTHGRRG